MHNGRAHAGCALSIGCAIELCDNCRAVSCCVGATASGSGFVKCTQRTTAQVYCILNHCKLTSTCCKDFTSVHTV
eukprot:16368-Heterococcus_DN1.PRE.4